MSTRTSDNRGKSSKLDGVRDVLKDPDWWMREAFTALVVGVIVAAAAILDQKMVDDARAEREAAAVAVQNRHSEQVEDLRFVRQPQRRHTEHGQLDRRVLRRGDHPA